MFIDSMRWARRLSFARVATFVAACALLLFAGPRPSAQSAPGPEWVPNELLVKFRPSAGNSRRTTLLNAVSGARVRRFARFDIDHIRLPKNLSVERALQILRAMPDVEIAQPNYIQRIVASAPPNDPYWLADNLWGLSKVSAPAAWTNFGTSNSGIVIADIDTGVNYLHPDLIANIWSAPSQMTVSIGDGQTVTCAQGTHGFNAITNTCFPLDDHGHGTLTSGVAGAVGNNGIGVVGVSWNAKIISCKFLNASGSGNDGDAISCFNYLVDLKVNHGVNIRVTNNSWGGTRGGGVDTMLQEAIDAAGTAGILNVFAAGNVGTNNDVAPFDPASMDSASIVSVAASDQNDNRANFGGPMSNYGPTTVDLAAPGLSIVSTYGLGYGSASGTSLATPFVSGAAALIAARNPGITVAGLKAALMSSVDKLAQWNGLVASGGRLNVFAAALAGSSDAPPSSNHAVFVRTDTTTQGNWIGVYGQNGYAVPNDGVSYPAYASVAFDGQTGYTWAPSTIDPRAPQRASGIGRIASTWYALNSFSVDINLTDGLTHQVALYGLDWDTPATRVQQVDVLDNATGAVLDSRTLNSFHDGQYLVWNLTGHVTLRLTRLAGWNAAFSGIFFDSGAPPNVSLAAPTGGATFTAPGPITLSANVTAAPGTTISHVDFYTSTTFIGTSLSASSPYSFTWANVPAGSHTLTARAVDSGGTTGTSAPISVTVSPPPASNQAVFVRTDGTTQGNWIGAYGHDGYGIPNDTTSYPAYATVTAAGQAAYTWAASTSDIRAVQHASGAGRIASTWYAGSNFTLDVNLTDGLTHQVALYALDWDTPTTRIQRIDVLDAATGAVLDTRTLNSFHDGQYVVWNLTGHTTFRVTWLGGWNAVVSGIFFDSGSPPSVNLATPIANATFIAPGPITLSANATPATGTTISRVDFYTGTTFIGTSSSVTSPYSFTWLNVPAGTHTLTARAVDGLGATGISAPISVGVSAPSASNQAVFVRTDSTTQGNWIGTYGHDGYGIPNDTSSYPAYAAVTFTGQAAYTWAATTSDVRAAQRASGAGRIASTWYAGSSFTVDINLTDGLTHQVALYALDWDTPTTRIQRIDVLDAATGAVLDTRTVNSFHDGQYVVWNLTGHVTFRLTWLGGWNAAVSGLFFDSASAPGTPSPNQATFVQTDGTTQGNWIGTYGHDGYGIPNDTSSYPAYATVSLSGQASYTWAASTSDVRAVRHASGTGRIASTWYAATSFTVDVNLTDGLTHQVALYALDWDTPTTRIQRIDVLDATTGAVLDTRTVNSFHDGQYLVWNLKGHVTIRLTWLAGWNAAVSGIFFQ